MPEIEVEIEKLVYGGDGLARVDGRTALVPFTLPGEQLTAEVTRERASVSHARPVSWIREAEERVPPNCPLFTDCGGCHYQHIPYERQLEIKTEILLETLARIGGIEWAEAVDTIYGDPWLYRNRTQLRVANRGPRAEVGFVASGSHRVVPASYCPINSPKLNAVHDTLREMAKSRAFPDFLREVEIFTNERDVQLNVTSTDRPLARKFFDWCGREIAGFLPGEYIEYSSGGDLFRVGSRSFFQVNRFLTDELAKAATESASGGLALDLYCGVGLLTLPLARQCERVIGVDSSAAATRSLQFNAQRAGVEVKSVHLNVDEYLESFSEPVDWIVADPPRSGLGKIVTRELLRIGAPTLSLVSCDPATLARDLKVLLAGGYRIDSLRLIDLFPQTYHIETLVTLRR